MTLSYGVLVESLRNSVTRGVRAGNHDDQRTAVRDFVYIHHRPRFSNDPEVC
jgi:hypothetical protein